MKKKPEEQRKQNVVTKDRLTGLRKLEPIKTVDELIDLAARILEVPGNNDEHEQFLDGLDRLHDQRDENFVRKTSSIRKKIVKDISMTGIVPIHSWTTSYPDDKPLEIDNYGYALCALMVIWTAESREILPNGSIRVVFEKESTAISFQPPPTLDTFFISRTANLARRICEGITQQPFCMPTHRGGWIDPIVFVKRLLDKLNAKNAYYDMLDYVLALYRLAPDRRLDALKLLHGKEHLLFSKTLKYLLGDSDISFTKTEIENAKTTAEVVLSDAEEKARKSR